LEVQPILVVFVYLKDPGGDHKGVVQPALIAAAKETRPLQNVVLILHPPKIIDR